MRLSRNFPRGAYVVANELLHLINDTPTRGPYLFLASPKRMQYEDGKSHDPGSLRTFFTWMRRQADTEIPDALDLPEAITCEIEPHTQGGPTTVVLRADDCIPDVPGPMTDAEQDARLRAYEKHWKNRDAYCQDLLDALAERIGPIAHAEQSSVLTQALHYRSSNVSNSVIIVGNGNVVGDGSSAASCRELWLHLLKPHRGRPGAPGTLRQSMTSSTLAGANYFKKSLRNTSTKMNCAHSVLIWGKITRIWEERERLVKPEN